MSERTAELEMELEARRERIAALIRGLRAEASPRQLVSANMGSLAGFAHRQAVRADGVFRSQPLAAAMMLGGLAWLAVRSGHEEPDEENSGASPGPHGAAAPRPPGARTDNAPSSATVKAAARHAAEVVSDGIQSAKKAVSTAGESVRQGVGQAAADMRSTVQDGKDQLYHVARSVAGELAAGGRSTKQFLDDHPFVAGGAAFAAGAIVGAAMLARDDTSDAWQSEDG